MLQCANNNGCLGNLVKKFLYVFVFALLWTNLMASDRVLVTIDYGGLKPTKRVEVELKAGMTALSALQNAADVTTKSVGKYTFVTSIDGVKSQSRKMGWFYQVDQNRADKLASDNVLGNIKTMVWEFKADNCLNRSK